MAAFIWSSTSSQDPLLGANWQKSDGTTGTAPTTGDDVYLQAVPGVTLAAIWASGGANLAVPTGLGTSAAATTGGNLNQSTTYFYKVTAINATGESLASAELTYAVPASGTSTNQITISWTAVSGATGYKIYRSTTTGQELYLATITGSGPYADISSTTPAGPLPGAATYNSLNVSMSFTPSVGIAGVNGYWKQPVTTLKVGLPSNDGSKGSGSGRIKIDLGSIQSTVYVYGTGQSVDSGYEPLRLLGTNASNKLYVLGGLVGVATNLTAEVSTMSEVDVCGSTAICNLGAGVTWTNAYCSAGALTVNSGSSGTLTVGSGATGTVRGTALVATVNTAGTCYLNNRPAAGSAVTTANLYGNGTLDVSGDPSALTISTLNHYAGGTLKFFAGNPGHLTITTRNILGASSLTAA